jgi:hypothetical protein
MLPLRALRFDDDIGGTEVCVPNAVTGEYEVLDTKETLRIARAQGLHLIAYWPEDREPESCFIGKLALPLAWEQATDPDPVGDLDTNLWFEAPCGGRDFLLPSNGHTHLGRMGAWCPVKETSYMVSLSEMGDMPEQTRYFVTGFLAGSMPDLVEDEDGYTEPHDEEAWRRATARFLRTGHWSGRWSSCEVCGCVLLPDSYEATCEAHTVVAES